MALTLIEKIGKNNSPIPIILNNKDFLKEQLNPFILGLSYREEFNPADVKESALEILEKEPLINRKIEYSGDSLRIRKKDCTIKDVKETLNYFKEELKEWNVLSFYLPWKGNWKGKIGEKISNRFMSLYGAFIGLSSLPIIINNIDKINNQRSLYGGGIAALGLICLGAGENLRRKRLKRCKREASVLNKMIDSYNIFKDNVKLANISVKIPQKAREIYRKVKEITNPGNEYEIRKVNFESVNRDLEKVYSKVQS